LTWSIWWWPVVVLAAVRQVTDTAQVVVVLAVC
jgi:hypothetical protein